MEAKEASAPPIDGKGGVLAFPNNELILSTQSMLTDLDHL